MIFEQTGPILSSKKNLFFISEHIISEEELSICNDTPENRFKAFVQYGWLFFSETSDGFISGSLRIDKTPSNESKKVTTGLDFVSIAVGGILSACGVLGK